MALGQDTDARVLKRMRQAEDRAEDKIERWRHAASDLNKRIRKLNSKLARELEKFNG